MTFKDGVRFWVAVFFASLTVGKAGPLVREANTTLTLPNVHGVSGYGVTNALGDLVFEQPVGIVSPPGETNRLFVLERAGRIVVVTNLVVPTRTLFLDLTTNTSSEYIERGLLGMDFHPNYASNGYFYVYRTLITSTEGAGGVLHDQLSRFETSPGNPDSADAQSEVVIFSQYDTNEEHNAGDVHFGPDGYLYVSLGEDKFPPDAVVLNRQPLDRKLHGGIVRIDVDKRPGSLLPNPHPAITTNYTIPPDNPFIGVTNYQGFDIDPTALRTEFYAMGFRNPWRFCMDPLNGDIYCADVGEGFYEEVSLITAGGNYGWPYREGAHAYWDPPPGFVGVDPIVEYAHGNATNQGNSVTGGVVYRGSAMPQLYGWYVFGDFVRGHIWATHNDGTPGPKPFQRLTGDFSIATFGYDPRDREILFANLHEGRIKKLFYVPPAEAGPFPQTLAETGAFSDLDAMTPQAGIVPYAVSLTFWSDYAHKRRWFSLPGLTNQFGFHAVNNWSFPSGSVWIKHFDMEITNGIPESRRKLETRFMVQGDDGVYGVTYIWDAAQTNAVLAPQEGVDEAVVIYNPDGSELRTQIWHYPSQSECRTCHNHSAGYALGFSTPQLNCDQDYSGTLTNQLLALSAAGYLDTNLTSVAEFRTLYAATDKTRSLYDRSRSYFQGNCYSCHHPGSLLVTSSAWDARVHVPLSEANIVDNSIITPNNPTASVLHQRISDPYLWRMPPIASSQLNQGGIALIRDWILSFPTAPWAYTNIGTSQREGSSAITGQEFQVAGSGRATSLASDALHFLSRPLTGNGHVVAQLIAQQPTGRAARAGLMLREDNGDGARSLMVSQMAAGGIQFEARTGVGGDLVKSHDLSNPTPQWIRLLRAENTFSGFVSTDGSNWLQVGELEANLAGTLRAGFGVVSDNNFEVNLARFTNFSFVEVSVTASHPPGIVVAPAAVTLEACVTHTGAEIARVDFLNGTNVLGAATTLPYTLLWYKAPAGVHPVTARVVDVNGLAVDSRTIDVVVEMPSGQAIYGGAESGTGGDWQARFGSEGYGLAADSPNLPAYVTLGIEAATPFIWTTTTDPRALMRADNSGRIAACWFSDETMIFDLPLTDGGLKRLTLYCLDWDHAGRSQRVDLVDGETSAILGSQVLTNFGEGVYLTWSVRGHLQVHVTPLTGNAVVSALFLDAVPNHPPAVQITNPPDLAILTAPTNITIQANASDEDGAIVRVEFFVNGGKISEVTNAPYAAAWGFPTAGAYTLTARAWDNLGESQLSDPAKVAIALPGAWAEFLQEDTAVQGDWLGAYGQLGYIVVDHATSLPAFADVFSTARTFTWANSVSATRALQHVAGSPRIASCYVDTVGFDLDASLMDGKPRQVALYFLDWDTTARQSQVTVSDLSSGLLLDSRPVQDFNPGKYLVWNIRGSVRFTITRRQVNAVVSGVFLDPVTSIDEWRSDAFPTEQLRDAAISGYYVDPDGDGRLNLFEYAVGSDPLVPNDDPVFWASFEPLSGAGPKEFILSYVRSKSADDVAFRVQGTSDWMTWVDVGSRFEPVDVIANADGKTETVRLRLAESPTEQLFLRLQINLVAD